MAIVYIPTPLARHVEGQARLSVAGADVRSALLALVEGRPGLREALFDGQGALRRYVNLFVNDEDMRGLDGLQTPLGERDRLEILPAIAGGISYPDWLRNLQQNVPQLDVAALQQQLADGPAPRLLDVRSSEEWAQGHLQGAVHIDRGFLEIKVETELPDRDAPLVVYCERGSRSLFAAQALSLLGYTRVSSLDGGLKAWKDAGGAIAVPQTLAAAERRRYLRHLAIPEVGEAGQLKLREARVLCIGAGGLGSPAALYLAAAGIGRLGLVDSDVVDESNLQRQILHTQDRVGMAKTASARIALLALNPAIDVVEHCERLSAANAQQLLEGYDLVVDGSDNFATRYLLNDACVLQRKPMVHGSVFRFEGQVSVFHPGHGPCYRCLHPEPPPPELAPSCAEAGVLGVLPGVIGVLQATEAIKLILGLGEPLIGRALRYDALAGTFRTLRFGSDPACGCAEGHAHELVDTPAPACALAGR